MKWVTIQVFSYSHEAQIYKHILEEAGVKTFLKDELFSQVYSFFNSQESGGVKLQVLEEDLQKAQNILGIGDLLAENKNLIIPKWFELLSQKMPIVKSLGFETRIFVALILFTTFVVLLLSLGFIFLV